MKCCATFVCTDSSQVYCPVIHISFKHKSNLSFLLFFHQKLMSDLEVKEKDLNKLKHKVDSLLKINHPASDKIEVNSHS